MKNIGILITIGMIAIGLVSGYAVMQYQVKENAKDAEKTHNEVVQMREFDIRQQEYGTRQQELDIRQSVQIESNTKLIREVEAKF